MVTLILIAISIASLILIIRNSGGAETAYSGNYRRETRNGDPYTRGKDLQKIRNALNEALVKSQGVIDSNDLLKIWEIEDCKEKIFPKRHLDGIQTFLNRSGYGLVPDYRLGHKRLTYNEPCVIYRAARILKEPARGTVHDTELFLKLLAIVISDRGTLQGCNEYIRQCFMTLNSPQEHYRYLYSYLLWLMQKKQAFDPRTKAEVSSLATLQKEKFQKLLLNATYIDGGIDGRRIEALKRILPTLGVGAESIHTLLHQNLTDEEGFATVEKQEEAREYSIQEPEKTTGGISLDKRRLEEFRAQTDAAREILSDIFVTDQETENIQTIESGHDVQGLLRRLFEKETWERSEIQELCGPDVMIGNMLEKINDYSYSKVEDIVVEEIDDMIYVTLEYKEYLI